MAVFDDLGIDSRRQILGSLVDGPLSVGEIVEATGLKQPNVSNHLARMRDVGTVRSSRMGREVIYSLSTPEVIDAVRRARIRRQPVPIDLPSLVEPYSQAALRGDEGACAIIVDRALRANSSLVDICEDLFSASMAHIGQLYQNGAIGIADEHAASAVTERMLGRASAAQIIPLATGYRAIVGCAPGNWHAIGPRMVADYLRTEGWRVMFLGANVPEESFIASAADFNPHLLMLSTCTQSSEAALSVIKALHESSPDLPIAIGGSGASKSLDEFRRLNVALVTTSLRETATWIQQSLADGYFDPVA